MKLRIGVLGPHACSPEEAALGRSVGEEIARRGAVLVCGGLGGLMTAAAEGAKGRNGTTVGVLPGDKAGDANPFIDLPLPTGLGAFRNALLVRVCDAVIAVRGGYGTLSELAFALRLGVPVVGLQTWTVSRDGTPDPGVHVAADPAAAVDLAIRLAQARTA
jgi:uncharacterized protein (TIGR00725 family)